VWRAAHTLTKFTVSFHNFSESLKKCLQNCVGRKLKKMPPQRRTTMRPLIDAIKKFILCDDAEDVAIISDQYDDWAICEAIETAIDEIKQCKRIEDFLEMRTLTHNWAVTYSYAVIAHYQETSGWYYVIDGDGIIHYDDIADRSVGYIDFKNYYKSKTKSLAINHLLQAGEILRFMASCPASV